MTKYTNKSIVYHGCESHATLYHDNTMVDESEECGDIHSTSNVKNVTDESEEESEGKDEASVVGCNANNANAGRTLNANNSVANSNDNYAGGFAHKKNKTLEETLTSQPSRLKKDEEHIDNVGYAQDDYESLPFMTDDIAESNAENMQGTIWEDLRIANSKRNLKGLSRFYKSKEIALYAVKRTTKKRDTKAKQYYYTNANEIADRLLKDINDDAYYVHGYIEVDLPRKYKTSKNRHAKIYTLYDRCMQNFCLTIIEQKLRRKVIRNNYSNIEKRGILCNDKRYCMMNKIRNASIIYNDLWVLNTDIKKFYQNINWKLIISVLFRTIKDKISRNILYKTFEASKDLPIGCCLSPIIADIIMNDYDNIILKNFKPRFYAAFGDNRLYVGRKDILQKILSFTRKYYRNHYHFKMKSDYQLKKVNNGFRFCKTLYENGFVRVRGEMRRRAIRSAHIPQSFAGYNGILEKSDSKHLLHLIKNNLKILKIRTINNTMEVRPFKGRKVNFDALIGKKVFVTDYKLLENGKDSKYYYTFQMISLKDGTDEPELLHTNNGSFEIKEACKQWEKENKQLPIKVTIAKEGTSFYFKEYHITDKEACSIIIDKMNIDISSLKD